MPLQQYLTNINKQFVTGNAREHSYRPDLQNLLHQLLPNDVLVTNEPARIACGAPDYIITRKNIPLGYIEAKDIGVDLDSKNLKEQFERYKTSLNNLIFTDYLQFHFYKDGSLTTQIAIAEVQNGKIVPKPENFDEFKRLMTGFAQTLTQSIKSPVQLAEMMANKAKTLANTIALALQSDEQNYANSALKDQMLAFRQLLIHDITPQAFADIYAQTIVYGMFAARYHDDDLNDFSREQAARLIPRSNPFLRKMFQDIAGYDLDKRIDWVVEELVNVFLASDVKDILRNFGKSTKQEDPIIHFYETFLAAYDPNLRKARGVWYTPEPVVNFIVRAVDDILKTDFKLPQGLADTSKVSKPVMLQGANVPTNKTFHKVQILDPATGTGTFLAEVIKHIYQKFKTQQGIWSNYVEQHLIPRLNGFELLMASYAMAHLKLDLLLTETGYVPNATQRFKVYLTNSLEEHQPEVIGLWANMLATEANEANAVKRDAPVMVVLGNPPYSGISINKSQFITNLINDYKYVDGEHFNERKHWLNDDYVKFIRFGEYLINKNNEGVLAYINNHSFLDNPTFRGMRWHLLQTFDTIYIIDLHGNSLKKETSPDGSPDQNVFDIQAGVSINIFVKTGKKQPGTLAKVLHLDLYGKRDTKYQFLLNNNLKNLPFTNVNYNAPFYFFQPQNDNLKEEYEQGFSLETFFTEKSSGIQTSRDFLVIDSNKDALEKRLNFFISDLKSDEEIRNEFFSSATSTKYLKGDTRGWQISSVRPKLRKIDLQSVIQSISYRPFDKQFIAYSSLLVDWTREKVLKNLLQANISITIGRQGQVTGNVPWNLTFIQDSISDLNLFYRGGGIVCPLYLYPESSGQMRLDGAELAQRVPNLNMEVVNKIAACLGLRFVSEKNSPPKEDKNSPPMEEMENSPPKEDKNSPPMEEVENSPPKEDKNSPPMEEVENSPPKEDKNSPPMEEVENSPPKEDKNSPPMEEVENSPPKEDKNSPPMEEVENSPPLEGCLQGGVVLTTINNTPIIRNFVENLPYNSNLSQLAKDKRKAGILSEVLFWQQIHKGLFHKIDFDRQRIIGNYIVDFYVKTLGLIIEIDGSSHDTKQEYDAERQAYLESLGLKVYRIADIDVKKKLASVMRALENYIIDEFGEKTTPPVGHPSKGGEFTPVDPSKGGEFTPVDPSKGGEFTPVEQLSEGEEFSPVEQLSEGEEFSHSEEGIKFPSFGGVPARRGGLLPEEGEFAPIDVLDYIYAILHSPNYREQYKAFLKIDFPRVPYPSSLVSFWRLVALGGQLRRYHLLTHVGIDDFVTQYPINGNNVVDKPHYEAGNVWINNTQYFADVPLVAWEFYIGGYQPAQKWLKDRKGRTLEFDDILHYQRIIVALLQTHHLMQQIDEV